MAKSWSSDHKFDNPKFCRELVKILIGMHQGILWSAHWNEGGQREGSHNKSYELPSSISWETNSLLSKHWGLLWDELLLIADKFLVFICDPTFLNFLAWEEAILSSVPNTSSIFLTFIYAQHIFHLSRLGRLFGIFRTHQLIRKNLTRKWNWYQRFCNA